MDHQRHRKGSKRNECGMRMDESAVSWDPTFTCMSMDRVRMEMRVNTRTSGQCIRPGHILQSAPKFKGATSHWVNDI